MVTPHENTVLDTNVWLDWLVFRDPSVQPLLDAGLSFVASQAMRDELGDVLKRSHFSLSLYAQDQCLAQFDQHTIEREAPAFSVTRLRCTDRDDQKFIELAVATRAGYLVTRDKALLKLAKRAGREHQLNIVRPSHWQPTEQPAQIQ